MKKVKLEDGTEIEVMEQSDIDAAVADAKKESDATIEDLNTKLEDATKTETEEEKQAREKKEEEDAKEDPFITSLKKDQEEKLEKQIKEAAFNNADLEAEIRSNMKSLSGSELGFDRSLKLASDMAITNNPEKGFADIISAGGEGTGDVYSGGPNNAKTLNPSVAQMFAKSTGKTVEQAQEVYAKTNK